jgi:hypothetical protein
MKVFKFLFVFSASVLCSAESWSLSADEAQSYSFAGSALSSSNTNNVPATSIALESSMLAEAHAESSLAHSRTDLEKKQQFQMENGYIGLTDDTSLWVGPLGASLNVKY